VLYYSQDKDITYLSYRSGTLPAHRYHSGRTLTSYLLVTHKIGEHRDG